MPIKLSTWPCYVHSLPTTDLLGTADSKASSSCQQSFSHFDYLSLYLFIYSLSLFFFHFIDIDVFFQTNEQCSRNPSKQSIRGSHIYILRI